MYKWLYTFRNVASEVYKQMFVTVIVLVDMERKTQRQMIVFFYCGG